MSSKIQLRRDSAANWTATNPVLAQGEPGLETDSKKVKYGDGTTAWNLLDYASGGAGGDYSTGFEDGVNENTYHFATVTGKKEFTFRSEGYRLVEITLTAPMVANLVADGNLTFTAADTPAMTDIWLNKDTYGNEVLVYSKLDYDSNNFNNIYNSMSSPSAGNFLINISNTDFIVDDTITIKYYQEGTTYADSQFDRYGYWIPDADESTATNEVTISTAEYPWNLGDGSSGTAKYDLLDPTNDGKHNLSFQQNNSNDQRNITNVVDNEDGTLTITFDGTAVQSKTTTTGTFNFTAVDSRSNDSNLTIPVSEAGTFITDCVYGYNVGTDTNKYTGGTSRCGYLTIAGGSPINFNWYGNSNNEVQVNLNMFDNVTYNSGDTIVVTYYKAPTLIELEVYRPGNLTNNWNNGYKWFDWKDDIETEYAPGEGNGIMAGNCQMLVVVYRDAIGSQGVERGSLPIQFGWTGQGGEQNDPYDPYNREWVNSYYQTYSCSPIYNFNHEGIVFKSTDTYYGLSYTYKVRIIYKFELIIGDESDNWFNC